MPFIALTVFAFLFGLAVADYKSAYEFVKDFQEMIATLVTGFLGFGGIVYTLKRNAELTREQRQEKIAQDNQRLLREVNTIRRALAGELAAIKGNLSAIKASVETVEAKMAPGTMNAIPLPFSVEPYTIVYRSLSSSLGLLGPLEAELVVQAYTHLSEFVDTSASCREHTDMQIKSGTLDGQPLKVFKAALELAIDRANLAIQNLGLTR